jgi:hypothetical protein
MTDQKSDLAEQKEVETETTQIESPTIESSITGDETTQTEEVSKTSVVEKSDDLPEDTLEQRRAFQEMRQEIKQLKEEKVVREKSESAFNVLRPQTPPVSQPGPIRVENYRDPLTGETNWTDYNNAVNNALVQNRQLANYEAQQSTQELIDENNARNKHPEIFADPEAEEEIASRYLFYKMRGENVSISDIAERVAKRYSKTVSKAEKIGAEKILNEVTEKESAGLSASSQNSNPARSNESLEDSERLSVQTRRGNNDAIAARISKIPWANK